MKANILIPFFLLTVFSASAQAGRPQLFKDIHVTDGKGGRTIFFTVSREVNVRYYHVEAGNDSMDMETVRTVRSAGNSVLPHSYRLMLDGLMYRFYRVCRVDMDGSPGYSNIVSGQLAENLFKPLEIDPVKKIVAPGAAALK